jgi:tRNA(fMet)-specific endonuclease VapC
MNDRFLLDTNVVIAFFRGDPEILLRFHLARKLFVPAITLGELWYGAQHSQRVAFNTARIERFGLSSNVLECDEVTARHYGVVKDRLRKRGRPVPENDIWIAAVAKQHDLAVATRDRHFRWIDGLEMEMW